MGTYGSGHRTIFYFIGKWSLLFLLASWIKILLFGSPLSWRVYVGLVVVDYIFFNPKPKSRRNGRYFSGDDS